MNLTSIESKLSHLPSNSKPAAFIGLDGFVDRIIRPVKKQEKDNLVFYDTITSFSKACGDASGISAQFELFTQEVKFGGNAPIFAMAMARLGVDVACMGSFGLDKVNPAFERVNSSCELLSLGEPAETIALEFDDGKLILSELSSLKNLTWENIKEKIGIDHLTRLLAPCNLISLVDWCNLAHATSIWKGFLHEVVDNIPVARRHFFFDLADPTKKSTGDIREILQVINGFKKHGEVILGMNENETRKIYQALSNKNADMPLEEVCADLYQFIDVDVILSHPVNRCILTSAMGTSVVPGRVVKKPKISTGGGDNLNSGFCFGLLHGFSMEESAVLGMANSGAYVQNGYSPSIQDLKNYLNNWHSETFNK